MAWKRRRREGRGRSGEPGTMDRAAESVDRQHLEQFVATRTGVEGFVEPRTMVTETTLLLVAIDGEWTRRRVPDARWAHNWANKLGVPTYDAAVVGVPQRMRDWNSRQRKS
jgi:hypothetical protein